MIEMFLIMQLIFLKLLFAKCAAPTVHIQDTFLMMCILVYIKPQNA